MSDNLLVSGPDTRAETSRTSVVGFRRDIQGLRALAVGIVVVDHAHLGVVAGGFVGVDVFFVISGFLITSLLLGDISTYSRVRVAHFYSRRAQRILPAATVTIVVTSLLSILLLGVIEARAVLVDSVWAVFFGANIHFANIGTNYFAASTGTSPLLHFWSLSVEEQFYLFWPALIGLLAVIFITRGATGEVPRAPIVLVLLAITLGSFCLSVVQTAANPTGAYFSTIDRTWELAVGALLAVSLPWLGAIPWSIRSLLSWSGVVAIGWSAVTFTTSTPLPSYPTLLPVLGSAAVIAGGVAQPRGGAHRFLSVRPLRFVGDLSYSLYLWHWPILIIGAAYLGARDTFTMRCVLVVVSLLVSAISYYGLENPMRHTTVLSATSRRGLLLWPVALGVVVSMAIFAVPGAPFATAAGAANGSLSPTQAIAQAVLAAQAQAPVPHATDPNLLSAPSDAVRLGGCSQYPKFTKRLCQLGDPQGVRTLVLFGNSHSVMWEPALATVAREAHWKFYAVVREECGYDDYVGLSGKPIKGCAHFYAWATRRITALHPDLVVMGSYVDTASWERGEAAVLAQLRPATKRLVLLSDVPWTPNSPASCLLAPDANQGTCLTLEPPQRIALLAVARSVARRTHVQYLDVANLLCDHWLCPALINGFVPTYDGVHLTPQYSTYVAPALGTALNLEGNDTRALIAVPIPVSG